MNFPVCFPFSITRALNTAETAYEWSSFSVLAQKWAYLKYERVLLYSNDRLVGFSSPSLSLLFIFFNLNTRKPNSLSRLKTGL